jgi:hypothetical protein
MVGAVQGRSAQLRQLASIVGTRTVPPRGSIHKGNQKEVLSGVKPWHRVLVGEEGLPLR